MKSILILGLLCGLCMANAGVDLENLVCSMSTGFGEGFVGTECAKSMNISCSMMFDVIPELIEFFVTMDFSKIGKLFSDLYFATIETFRQWKVCDHWKHIVNFIPHLINFFKDIGSNFQKIMNDAICVGQTWVSQDYYSCGICLGNILKIIFASQKLTRIFHITFPIQGK